LENEDLTKVVINPNDSQILFAGSRSDFSSGSIGCFFKSTNSGTTWDTIIVGITVRDIVINPFNPEIIYIAAGANAGNDPGVLKTTDNGTTWFNADSGVVVNWETNVNTVRMDPNEQEILFCGTGGFMGGNLYKSTNGGNSWFIPCEDSIFEAGVEVIEFDPFDPIVIYVGRSWDGKLSRSSDGGVTWEYAGYSNGGSIRALQFGQNSDEIYIASSWSFAYPVGIFITTDRGNIWNNLGEDFTGSATVHDVKVYFDNFEHVYIVIEAWEDTTGMYVKKNNQHWEHYGLTDIIIRSIAIENNLIYAATDSGLYVRDLLSSVDFNENNLSDIKFLLYPAYPNPFNPVTKIKYTIPQSPLPGGDGRGGLVTLIVYNALGRKVEELVNEFKPAGKYEIQFDGSDLPSGVYFYKLQSDNP
jgi:photosystem II stability/assembly factor-like uncharacterized protein